MRITKADIALCAIMFASLVNDREQGTSPDESGFQS